MKQRHLALADRPQESVPLHKPLPEPLNHELRRQADFCLRKLLECVNSGRDLNGLPFSAEELSRSLQSLASLVEGK